MWDLAALHLLPAQSVIQVSEEQVDGLMGQLPLGSRNLSADAAAPSQEPSPWISAIGLLAALATTTSGSAFSQVQPRVGQGGCPF